MEKRIEENKTQKKKHLKARLVDTSSLIALMVMKRWKMTSGAH